MEEMSGFVDDFVQSEDVFVLRKRMQYVYFRNVNKFNVFVYVNDNSSLLILNEYYQLNEWKLNPCRVNWIKIRRSYFMEFMLIN